MVTHAKWFVALVAGLLIAAGSCCCGGVLLVEFVRSGNGAHCCAEQTPSAPQHKECRCSGQVLLAGSVSDHILPAPSPCPQPLFGTSPARQADMAGRAPVPVLHRATAHAPPPKEMRRTLQVWLI